MRMLGAVGDDDLAGLGRQAVMLGVVVGEGLAQLGDAGRRRVVGVARPHRPDGGLLDVRRGRRSRARRGRSRGRRPPRPSAASPRPPSPAWPTGRSVSTVRPVSATSSIVSFPIRSDRPDVVPPATTPTELGRRHHVSPRRSRPASVRPRADASARSSERADGSAQVILRRLADGLQCKRHGKLPVDATSCS